LIAGTICAPNNDVETGMADDINSLRAAYEQTQRQLNQAGIRGIRGEQLNRLREAAQAAYRAWTEATIRGAGSGPSAKSGE